MGRTATDHARFERFGAANSAQSVRSTNRANSASRAPRASTMDPSPPLEANGGQAPERQACHEKTASESRRLDEAAIEAISGWSKKIMLANDHAGIARCVGHIWLRGLRADAESAAIRGRSMNPNAAKDHAVFARLCGSHGLGWWLRFAQTSGRMDTQAIEERRGM